MSRPGFRAFALALFGAASMLDACGGGGAGTPRVIATRNPTTTPPATATSTAGTPKPSPTPTDTPTPKPTPTPKSTPTPKPTPTPFDDVPASVAFGAPQTLVVAGESRTFDVSATLVNAEGKKIKSDYTPGVKLSVSGDARGALALSQTTLVTPTTRVRITFDGSPLIGLSETFGTLKAPYAVLTPSIGNTTFRIGALAVYLNGTSVTSATLKAKVTDTLEVVEAVVDVTKPLEFTVKTSNATIASTGIAAFAIGSTSDVPVALPVTGIRAGKAKISIGGQYVRYTIEFAVK